MREYFSHPGGLGGKDDPVQADPTKQHSGTSPGENVTKSEGQPQLHRQCQHVQVFLIPLKSYDKSYLLLSQRRLKRPEVPEPEWSLDCAG